MLTQANPLPAVLIDCTDSAMFPGNPGVVRTTRQLGRALAAGGQIRPIFAVWDRRIRQYRKPTAEERGILASFGGPHSDDSPIEDATMLLLTEAPIDGQIAGRLLWAHARRLTTAALLYDLIPLSHPDLCVPAIVRNFPEYLEGVCTVDTLFAISGESFRQLEHQAAARGFPLPPRRHTVWLPAQFGHLARETSAPPPGPVRCLSVGSIEPRKNQAALVTAFDRLRRRRPDLELELILVGNRFAGAEALAERIETLARETGALQWLGLVDDDQLAELFRSASFTAYPSLIEGFGLPIAESLWLGRPCLCHHAGVMAELAAAGGCLTTDMRDPAAIEAALERLAADAAFRQELTAQATTRPLTDWTGYAAEITRGLLQTLS